jgi:hypothetical protein
LSIIPDRNEREIMKEKIIVLFITFLISVPAYAIEPVTNIIEQKNAPLKITLYSASYRGGGNYTSEGIRHSVIYRNVTIEKIAATEIGFVSFNVWNEYINLTRGTSISEIMPDGTGEGIWTANAYGDSAFLTGFAYVSKVRFVDGRIWTADLNALVLELRKIQQDFDLQKLKDTLSKE